MMVHLKESAVVVDDVIAVFCVLSLCHFSLQVIARKKEMSLTTNSKNIIDACAWFVKLNDNDCV